MYQSIERKPIVRDKFDFNPGYIEEKQIMHKMFNLEEISTDSNEREMIGGRQLILSSLDLVKNSEIVIHFDNMNAALIYMKGSPKYRLQKYAIEMDDLALKYNCSLKTSTIPRSLNYFSDTLSHMIDLEDYGVSREFFKEICEILSFQCNYDRFATNVGSILLQKSGR